MRARTNRLFSLELARYVAVGMANTVVGYGVICLLKWGFAVQDYKANFFGYALGLVVSYVLHARWTFLFRGSLNSAALRFVALVAVSYGANLCVTAIAIEVLRLNSYLGQLAGVAPYALISYLGSKYFVFVDKQNDIPPTASGVKGANS